MSKQEIFFEIRQALRQLENYTRTKEDADVVPGLRSIHALIDSHVLAEQGEAETRNNQMFLNLGL